MTITQLTTFIKISELNSFSAAASSLGYAQSTVTTQIKQLEEELGCPLFDRLGKTIVITSAGERLIAYAEKLLQLEREIHLEVAEDDEPSGVLKIGVSESLCVSRFPAFLMAYKKAFPKINVRLQFIMHDTFPEMLQKGELDLVYTLNPLIEDETLKLLYKKSETMGFYSAPDLFSGKKKIIEKDLTDIPLLLTGHDCSFRNMLIEDLGKAGIVPQIALETSSKEILKHFAMNGLGVAFIPDMSAETEVIEGKLKRLNWRGAEFPIYSQLFVHKDKHLNKAIRGLVDIIMNVAV